MAKDHVSIELDKASQANLQKQFEALGVTMGTASKKAIYKVLMKIKTEAQMYLTGRGHIVTSRLKNSLHVQMNNMKATARNASTYKDKNGNSYNSEMKTVSLNGEFEGAIGTNVDYAGDIEFGFRPHKITAKNGKCLSFLPKAKGQAWFPSKTRSTLKKYYADGSGGSTLKQNRVFVKSVNHPGFKGDSYLYRALKNVDVTKSVGDDLRNSLKFGKYAGKGVINRKIGNAMTNAD